MWIKEVCEMKKDYSEYFRKPSLKEAAERKKEIIINKDGLEVPSEMVNVGKEKKYFIRTYGCQGNEADSEVIAGILEFLKENPQSQATV